MNFRVTTQKFCMVGGYTEDLEKPQNCQNLGVGACPGQYDTCMENVSSGPDPFPIVQRGLGVRLAIPKYILLKLR